MKYLNLASGASHFITPDIINQATIRALQNGQTFYGLDEGAEILRAAISKRYWEDYDAVVDKENILVTSGTKQALFNLFSVLLQPGDEVILPKPSWFGFLPLLEKAGAIIKYLETSSVDNNSILPANLEKLITTRTKLFIFSNPNNPTGRIYSSSEVAGLLEVLQNHSQVIILSDEIYDLVRYDNTLMPSITQFPAFKEQTILVNGFSKNFAMSGWRIGYLIATPELFEKCLAFQHTTISGVNPFIQEGAAAALKYRAEILPEFIKTLTKNRELICQWLDKFPEINYVKPQGAYYIFADFRKVLEMAFILKNGTDSSEKLNDYFRQELQVEFVPGERFGMVGFFRITFAVSQPDLLECLSRLENFLFKN